MITHEIRSAFQNYLNGVFALPTLVLRLCSRGGCCCVGMEGEEEEEERACVQSLFPAQTPPEQLSTKETCRLKMNRRKSEFGARVGCSVCFRGSSEI